MHLVDKIPKSPEKLLWTEDTLIENKRVDEYNIPIVYYINPIYMTPVPYTIDLCTVGIMKTFLIGTGL